MRTTDLTSNWCLSPPLISNITYIDIANLNWYNVSTGNLLPNWTLLVHQKRTSKRRFIRKRRFISGSLSSVPMALGKHLFSSRTQKLSLAAAIILPQVGN